jgi:hypothetical protein
LPFDKLMVARHDGARSRIFAQIERPRVAVIPGKSWGCGAAVLAHIDLGRPPFTRGSSCFDATAIHNFAANNLYLKFVSRYR